MTEAAPGRRVHVRVPASSANLGPGFDVLAAALDLHLDLEVTETGAFAVRTDLSIARGRENLVVRAFERLRPADGVTFRITSEIPLSGGLGSSAAAIVAGLLAARALGSGPGGDEQLQPLAAELEGHPDNVGAALHGGFVICDGDRVRRLAVPAGLEAILVVPFESVRTARARQALPSAIPLADVTANLAAISTLVLGLVTGDLELVAAGLRDRVHQPYRGHLFPRSAELLERAPGAGALGATISGAGPTVLVWTAHGATEAVTEWLRGRADGWAAVIPASFQAAGPAVQVAGPPSSS